MLLTASQQWGKGFNEQLFCSGSGTTMWLEALKLTRITIPNYNWCCKSAKNSTKNKQKTPQSPPKPNPNDNNKNLSTVIFKITKIWTHLLNSLQNCCAVFSSCCLPADGVLEFVPIKHWDDLKENFNDTSNWDHDLTQNPCMEQDKVSEFQILWD